jgi:hypothetical protein
MGRPSRNAGSRSLMCARASGRSASASRQFWRGGAGCFGLGWLSRRQARRCGRGRGGRCRLRDEWGRPAGVQSTRRRASSDRVGREVVRDAGSRDPRTPAVCQRAVVCPAVVVCDGGGTASVSTAAQRTDGSIRSASAPGSVPSTPTCSEPRSSWLPSTRASRSETYSSPPATPTLARPRSMTVAARTSTATPPTWLSPLSPVAETTASGTFGAGQALNRPRVMWTPVGRRACRSPRRGPIRTRCAGSP